VEKLSEKTSNSKSKSTGASKSKSKTTSKPKAKTTKRTAATTKAKTTKKTVRKKATTKAKKPTKLAKPTKKSKKKSKMQKPTEVKPSKPRRLPLEKPVRGVLMNYQRGTVNQRSQYGLIQLEGVTSLSQAAPYIGRSVIIHFNEQNSNRGRIISAHGRNGVLRVRFRRSLAAEAVAKEVLVY
jgi:ribosomal protein L35AE/L33A